MWAGIKEVIVAHPDPNPTVRGSGFQVLEDAIAKSHMQLITELDEDILSGTPEVEVVNIIASGDIVIDIRHPDEVENSPLKLDKAEATILNIPFYSLRSNFNELEAGQRYLLYCDRGMMSRLHAAHLLDEGFPNVSVLDLKAH